MLKLRTSHFVGFFVPLIALAISACGEKLASDQAPASSIASPQLPVKAASLVTQSGKFGIAAHLPISTEFFFGTLNLKAHMTALEKTAYWKEISAFYDDKVPSPSKSEKSSVPEFEKMVTGDVFVAAGKGSSTVAEAWRELSDLYSEISYRGLMSGGPFAGAGGGSPTEQMVQGIVSDTALLKRASALISALKVPPLIVGMKAEKPDDLLKLLQLDDKLAELTKKGAQPSDLATPLGGKFKVIRFHVSDLLTDEDQKKMLEGIPESLKTKNPAALDIVMKAIDDIQTKPVAIAYGTVSGHAVIAIGEDTAHLQFVETPAESLLAKPEFKNLEPYADKDLLFIASASAAVAEASVSKRPTQPFLRGILSGLKGSDMFRDLATGLEPRISMLGEAEEKLTKRTFTDAVGIGWWSEGLHLESFGGQLGGMLDAAQPLRFASLLDDPGLVFGAIYRLQPGYAADSRAYIENWVEMIHHVSRELLRAGLGGEQGGQMAAMVDEKIIPELVKLYRSSRDLDQKGLGTEHAFIVDMGGTMAGLPGLPPAAAKKKMLRIAGVSPVKDRAVISAEWTRMEAALKATLAGAPLPMAIALPNPISSEKNGITTYFYPIPFATEDLLPSASVNDKLFMFGTSKNLHEKIAGQLTEAKPEEAASGLRYKVRFSGIRELIQTSAALAPDPDQSATMGTATQWIAPLGDLTGRSWMEGKDRRDSFSWEIHDVKKFD
jgi:hypothetical protein